MNLDKIKIGQTRRYKSRAHEGKGKVTNIETKTTGSWVTLSDTNRGKFVTVRPSQVSPL